MKMRRLAAALLLTSAMLLFLHKLAINSDLPIPTAWLHDDRNLTNRIQACTIEAIF